jgi:hypothetical protein
MNIDGDKDSQDRYFLRTKSFVTEANTHVASNSKDTLQACCSQRACWILLLMAADQNLEILWMEDDIMKTAVVQLTIIAIPVKGS